LKNNIFKILPIIFLPHLSSMFFKNYAVEGFLKEGIDIPEHKWFLKSTKSW